jgi:hypothetical protein
VRRPGPGRWIWSWPGGAHGAMWLSTCTVGEWASQT